MLGPSNDAPNGIEFKSQPGVGSTFWFTIEDRRYNISPIRQLRLFKEKSQKTKMESINIELPYLTQPIKTCASDKSDTKKANQLDHSISSRFDEDIDENGSFDLKIQSTRGDHIILSKSNLKTSCSCSKILIVDDYPFNILSLQRMLESLGHSCESAYHGEEALKKLNDRKLNRCGEEGSGTYELIFMDCNMPIMNGFEATSQIRKNELIENTSPITIIGCTAYVTESANTESTNCGMDNLINKPLNRMKLKELCDGVINQRATSP
jgi:CheY-like chemotaxis protein